MDSMLLLMTLMERLSEHQLLEPLDSSEVLTVHLCGNRVESLEFSVILFLGAQCRHFPTELLMTAYWNTEGRRIGMLPECFTPKDVPWRCCITKAWPWKGAYGAIH